MTSTLIGIVAPADEFKSLSLSILAYLEVPVFRDVNETLRSETETFDFQFETRPRPRPSHFFRDRDRDQDVRFWVRDETETETLIGRDRDIFRDLWHVELH